MLDQIKIYFIREIILNFNSLTLRSESKVLLKTLMEELDLVMLSLNNVVYIGASSLSHNRLSFQALYILVFIGAKYLDNNKKTYTIRLL